MRVEHYLFITTRLSGVPVCQGAAVCASQESASVAGQDPSADGADPERQSHADYGRPQPDAARLVWLLQTRAVFDVSGHRRLCASTTPGDLTATAQASER